MEGLPAVFGVLGILFEEPACEAEQLSLAVDALVDELENNPNSISFEFAPFVMTLLVSKGLQSHVSGRALEVLQSHARSAALRSVSRDHVMGLLAARFADNDVHAVLLKGAAMDVAVYPKEAFRLGCDVDILVRSEDFGRLDEVLRGLAKNIEKTPGKPATTAFAIEKTFMVSNPVEVQLDVHREITVPFVYPIDYKTLLASCNVHPAHKGRFKCLSIEDNLIQFAMHAFYDLQMFQKQTIDAYLLLRTGELDWPKLVSRAIYFRALQPVKYLLEGVRQVFGTEPPLEVRGELEIKGPRKWLAGRLLGGARRMSIRPGLGFRLRQLTAQFLLSGNITGWTRYYVQYSRAKLRDLLAIRQAII